MQPRTATRAKGIDGTRRDRFFGDRGGAIIDSHAVIMFATGALTIPVRALVPGIGAGSADQAGSLLAQAFLNLIQKRFLVEIGLARGRYSVPV